MAAIELKGIEHETTANELLKVLGMLKEIGSIMQKNTPTHSQAEEEGIISFHESMFEAESIHSDLVCELSKAIGKLVTGDISNNILQ